MKENCPRCDSNNWELNNEHGTCYCKNCHGFFGQEQVKEHWKQNKKQLSKYEQYAEIGNKTKPQPIREDGQYPYRCPICREKHLYKDAVTECINVCWNKVKEIRKSTINS
jgi:hypothetical protein